MESSVDPNEWERLQALSKYEILDSPPEPAFDDLTALAAEACDAPISVLTFLDKGREWFKSRVGLPVLEVPRDNAFCDHTIKARDVLVVQDATKDERFAHNPLVEGEPHIRFFAGYPLLSADGYGLGALCVLDRTPHELDFKQRQALKTLGHEATMLLELRREIHELRHGHENQLVALNHLETQLLAEKAEHHRAESALRTSERQLADAQRLAKLGSWEWDLQSDKVVWSDELYRIFGVQPKDFKATYEAYLQFVHPDDRARTDALIQATLKARSSFIHEKRIIDSHGITRSLYSSGEVIVDESMRPVRMVGFAQDITARKKIEEKLANSVSLLNSILESTADGILALDLNGHLLGYNQKFLEMWRLPPELMTVYQDELVLQRVLDQLKSPDAFWSKVQDLYNHPEQNSTDLLEFKDGRVFERYSQPQHSGDKIIGRVWSFRDVTDLYRAMTDLRRREEQYRSLGIASAQVVWTTDAGGRAVEESPSWGTFTGQSKEQMLGSGWMNAIHSKDKKRVAEEWPKAIAAGRVFDIELCIRRVDGQWRDMILRAVPILENNGRVREWVGSIRDITESKRAEQKLIDERDFSDALINSLPGIFYLINEKGRFERWNKNLETVSGYSAAEIKQLHVTQLVPEEDRQWAEESMHTTFATGRVKTEVTLLTKVGERLPYFVTGQVLQLQGQLRTTGVAIDISDQKRAEEEIKKLNQQLETRVQERTMQLQATNKELQDFSYSVSHDLKAPLRAIAAFAEAIEEDCEAKLDPEHRDYLSRIGQAATKMTRLIEDLLAYSRIGQGAIHLGPVQLDQTFKEASYEFKFQLDAIGARLIVEPNLPTVTADPSLLSQVFSNLIENAIIYRKKDTPLEIVVSCRREKKNVVICVKDNGIGIAQAHYQRIFEMFQRLHTNDQYPGTGIGLANVKKAIELQGGRVWVESESGRGSTFCVELQAAS